MMSITSSVKRACRAVLVLGSALFLSACLDGGISGPSVDSSRPVQVALLVPYSSETESDAAMAQSIENAARLAMGDLTTVTIDLRVYPTAGNPEGAAQAARTAVSEGAKVILGPVYGGNAKTAGLAAGGVNVMSFSNNPDVAGGNVYILGPTFKNTADRLTRYAVANGRTKIMVVNGNSPAENVGAASIKLSMAENGLLPVAEQSFEMSQQDVVNAVRPISETVEESEANAIFFTSGNDGAMPLLAQMLPENGVTAPEVQYIGLQRWNFPASALSLPGMQNSWFAIPNPALTQGFSDRYTAQYGSAPHSLAALAYDGIAIIGALVASGTPNPLGANALTSEAGFAGVNGIIRFKSDGTNERGLSIATIQDNQVIELDPAPRSFGPTSF